MELRSKQIISLAAVAAATAIFACSAATGDSDKAAPRSRAPPPRSARPDDGRGRHRRQDDHAGGPGHTGGRSAGAGPAGGVRGAQAGPRRNDQRRDRDQGGGRQGQEQGGSAQGRVTDKLADAAQADVDAFYDQNKARFGAQTKEQLAPQIAAMLKNQKMGDAQRAYLKTLRDKYGVKTMLEPPGCRSTSTTTR